MGTSLAIFMPGIAFYASCTIILMNGIASDLVYSVKVPFRMLRHLILFTGMNLLFTWVIYTQASPAIQLAGAARIVFINSLFFFGYAYLTAYLFVPLFIPGKRFVLFILSFVAAGFLISWLKFVFSETVFYQSIGDELTLLPGRFDFPKILMNTKDMTFVVALFLIAKFTRDNHRIRKRIAELQQYQLNSELRLLRNQLDPHVIFNNLNNIYCLSLNSMDTVSNYLRKLYTVLSHYFKEEASRPVPLEREIDAIRAFVGLEQLRYGERVEINFRTEGNVLGKEIYPFVLFSYVENCFMHGCSPDSGEAWIHILIKSEKDSLTFHSSNSKPRDWRREYAADQADQFKDKPDTLGLLYPDQHTVSIDDREDAYTVDIKIEI